MQRRGSGGVKGSVVLFVRRVEGFRGCLGFGGLGVEFFLQTQENFVKPYTIGGTFL